MNILTNEFKIMNTDIVENIIVENNSYIIKTKHTENNIWSSFGLHIVPNILFKKFKSLNIFNFRLNFDYELTFDDNIRIYNGISWNTFSTNNITGTFNEMLNFNFSNNYWRISTKNQQSQIIIKNINIEIVQDEIYDNYKSKKSLLLIGGDLNMCKEFDITDKKLILTFSNNYVYYIKNYFINKYDFNVYNISLSETESNEKYLDGLLDFDYCIDISQLGISKKGVSFYTKLRNKIHQKICSISDNGDNNGDNYLEDIVLCAINNNNIKCKYIEWAADESLFKPEQNINQKIILIDDCHYNMNEYNDSYNVLDYCMKLLENNDNIKIIRFGYYDNVINFIDKYKNKYNSSRYEVIENKISIEEKAKIHNKSLIFFGTHYETLGIPLIESAMAGNLLIYKLNYVNPTLTKDLLKIEYKNIDDLYNIDIFAKVNIEKQRTIALNNTWEKLVDRIYEILK